MSNKKSTTYILVFIVGIMGMIVSLINKNVTPYWAGITGGLSISCLIGSVTQLIRLNKK